MLWVVAAVADDVGGMRAPGGTTVWLATPALLFWVVVALWVIGVAWRNSGAGLAERLLAVMVAVLLGAKVFGVPW